MRPIPVVIQPPEIVPELDLAEKSADLSDDVSNSSQEIARPNKHRTSCTITNDSAVVIYLQLGRDAVANKGIRLNASGGAYEINKSNPWKGSVYAIAASAGSNRLCVTEVESRYASV